MMLDGHTPAKTAALPGVSPVTAKKWLVESRREQAAERSPEWTYSELPILNYLRFASLNPD